MKKILLFCLLIPVIGFAQTPVPVPVSYEKITFDNTVGGVGFSPSTLTVNGYQVRTCSGTLETAAIRYRIEGTAAPTDTEGQPLSVGQNIRIDGFTALTRFRGIRTTGTSGIIRFSCSR